MPVSPINKIEQAVKNVKYASLAGILALRGRLYIVHRKGVDSLEDDLFNQYQQEFAEQHEAAFEVYGQKSGLAANSNKSGDEVALLTPVEPFNISAIITPSQFADTGGILTASFDVRTVYTAAILLPGDLVISEREDNIYESFKIVGPEDFGGTQQIFIRYRAVASQERE